MYSIENKRILLIISGGIAAYKCLSLIRLIRRAGGHVTPVLTAGGRQFVTELSVASLAEEKVYTDLWSLKDETEMGHIRLSREADIVLVAPASANLIARMANGLADDLASTLLLATNKPVMIAPAMNPQMWTHPATQRNIETLKSDGITLIGPASGDMACGETGLGRMAEPEEIFGALIGHFEISADLAGKRALVTSGPTYEPLDPVRFLGNRSSGKQGHVIAKALSEAGADVTLVTGPVALPDPTGVKTIHVETAADMLAACEKALPVDIAVCAAAVSDWAAEEVAGTKIKKKENESPPALRLKENPDILAALAQKRGNRPDLVIGFAAETGDLLETARKKRERKGCDWIAANDVSPENKVFGSDTNHIHLITGHETFEFSGQKQDIARSLIRHIVRYFKSRKQRTAHHTETQKQKKKQKG